MTCLDWWPKKIENAEVVSPQDKYVVSLRGAELLFEEFKPLVGLQVLREDLYALYHGISRDPIRRCVVVEQELSENFLAIAILIKLELGLPDEL